jgi:pimeloyl-ACP methyl ester carboxylesterase/DNA-binding CsgD family transcriptional regulator
MTQPRTRYARSGDVRIAYQVIGHGPIDLVFVPGYTSNLEVHWEDAGFAHLLNRLSGFTRLILFDKRGTGLSDRVDPHHLPNLETRMDDVRIVMDAVGSGRAALLGASEGGPMSILFAATYPERTRALVLYGSYAHFHTWVLGRDALEDFIRGVEASWGSGARLKFFAPGRLSDERFQEWWARFERLSASPGAAIALARMNAAIDVRHVLASIRVPTLVLHRSEDARVKIAGGRYLADKIYGARFVELAGRDHPIWTGDVDRVVDEIEEFLTGERALSRQDRVLSTLMISRIATPERAAARLGDHLWHERLELLRRTTEDGITRFGGKPFGEGTTAFGARFDGPARAVRCAVALREAAARIGLALATGVHTGEIEAHYDAIGGLALHVTERIASLAGPEDVLVSGVVTDLVAGSGLHFAERASEVIGGLESPLRLLSVVVEQHLQPTARSREIPPIEVLSPREREVLALVAKGLSNAVIADRLCISDHTVKRHVANILLKLNLPTRAAAAAVAARHPID